MLYPRVLDSSAVLDLTLLPEFRTYLLVNCDYGPRTVENSVKGFRWMVKYLAERPFTLENCLCELARLKEEGKTPATRASIVMYIRRICNFLEYKYKIPPFTKDLPNIKVPPTITDTLNTEEIQAIYTASIPPSKYTHVYNLFLEMLARTGRRISEIEKLIIKDIDFKENNFIIRDPKNHDSRLYPVPHDLCIRLEALCRDRSEDNHVFVVSNGKKITPVKSGTIRSIMTIRRKHLGIRGRVSPHVFRHSFPVELLRRKVPLPLVSELMGHKNWQSTKRYTHLVMEDMRAASNFHPLNQANLSPEELIEGLKKEVDKYKGTKRDDVEFEVREGNGIYEVRVRWKEK